MTINWDTNHWDECEKTNEIKSKLEKLILHEEYSFDYIKNFVKKHSLCEDTGDCLGPVGRLSISLSGEIGEITLPLYFEDNDIAANFILTGFGHKYTTWRCVYICDSLSVSGRHEI